MNALAIAQHVPLWVPAIFVALLVYGLRMTRDRVMPLGRTIIVPVVMGLLSFSGVVSAFPGQMPAIAGWVAGMIAVVAIVPRWIDSEQVSYDRAARRFAVPGSWAPLALMMALFALKFGVGMTLGLHPALGLRSDLSAAIGLLYGAFAGGFLARAMALWRVAAVRGSSTLAGHIPR